LVDEFKRILLEYIQRRYGPKDAVDSEVPARV